MHPSVRMLVVAMGTAALAGCSSASALTEQDAVRFAELYVEIINTSDAESLSALLNNPANPGDADDRLVQGNSGPWNLTDCSVTTLTPGVFKETLKVSSAQGDKTWELWLIDENGRFVVGPLNAPTDSTGASTDSPNPN